MKHFKIRKGEWASAKGAPPQVISETVPVHEVALLGTDFPGLRPRFEVAEGDLVQVGQVLFTDRKHPEVAFVSPVDGRVSSIGYGPRRTLSGCVIQAMPSETEPTTRSVPRFEAARQELLSRGHWPAFRTRPFGRIPAPDAQPAAIVVNAVHAMPQAPDPSVVLADRQDAFEAGLRSLLHLTDGPVFVSQSPGERLTTQTGRIDCAVFSGSTAAGLASVQIDRLCPAGLDRQVWTVGYQDVVAIGQMFLTGDYAATRVVSITGAAADRPRLVRTPLGARLVDLCAEDTGEPRSGSAIHARPAAYLGRFDDQVTLVAPPSPRRIRSWLERLQGNTRALIPHRGLDRALAVDIPTVPLLRALSVGDSETAQRLGCLSLVEEDVAALAHRCTSQADYPRLLRNILDDLMDEAA